VISKAKIFLDFEDFDLIDIRIGTIIKAINFEEVNKPAYQLLIDFGSLGQLKSSAQITQLYLPNKLIGKQVVAVVNLGHKKILNFKSQCLILGVSTKKGISLLEPSLKIQNGSIVI